MKNQQLFWNAYACPLPVNNSEHLFLCREHYRFVNEIEQFFKKVVKK